MDEPTPILQTEQEIKNKTVEEEVLGHEDRIKSLKDLRNKNSDLLKNALSKENSNKKTTDLIREVIKKAAEQQVWPIFNEGICNDLCINWGIKELANMIRESSEDQIRKIIAIADSLGDETRRLTMALITPYNSYTDSFRKDFKQISSTYSHIEEENPEIKEMYFEVLREIAEDQKEVKSRLIQNEGLVELATFIKKSYTKESFLEKLKKDIPWQTLETFLPSMCQEAYDLTESYDSLELVKIKAHLIRIASDCEVVINNLKKPLEMIKKEEERVLTKDEFKKELEQLKTLVNDDKVLERLSNLEKQVNKLV